MRCCYYTAEVHVWSPVSNPWFDLNTTAMFYNGYVCKTLGEGLIVPFSVDAIFVFFRAEDRYIPIDAFSL